MSAPSGGGPPPGGTGPRPRPTLRLIEGSGPRVDLVGPALELAAAGFGLTLTITWMANLPPWFGALGRLQSLYVLAFAFFALALLRAPRYAHLPRAGLAVFAVAFACRVVLLPVAPSLSGDLHRYVWEGRVVAHGGNPYRQAPDDPALAPLRDPAGWTPINHKSLSTIYPPAAMAGFALVAAISPTVLAMKVWIVLHDLALVLVLLAWSHRRGAGAIPVIAYAWNPLVLIEGAGSGHHDPTAMLWLAVALWLADRRPVVAALALALGALTKLLPVVALPFLWRHWPWRARLAALVPIAAGFAWYATATRSTHSGLVAYWDTWRNNALLFPWIETATDSFAVARAVAIALVLGVAAWAWRRRPRPAQAAEATRDVTRAGLLLAPVAHPWYFGWALMFEPLGPSWPWLLLSLTATLNYGVFATPAEGRAFHLPVAWRLVEYGLPALLALALAAARRRRDRREGRDVR